LIILKEEKQSGNLQIITISTVFMDLSRNTVVLVIDIQNDYCSDEGKFAKSGDNAEWAQKAANDIIQFINEVRKIGIPIYHMGRSVRAEDISDFERKRNERMGVGLYCEENAWGSEFYKIQPIEDEQVILKKYYSCL